MMGQSKIGAKVALLKPLSSAISIGTGGPFGAEGPIIMTGGACGSLIAQMFHLSAAERKTLLVAGAAGGMAAIFAAPVAAVLLAVELLLFEWKPRSFIPVAVAAATAGALRVPLMGGGPVFPTVAHAPLTIEGLVCALLVGLLAGAGSGALTYLVYAFEDLFGKLKMHWMWWPILGGLCIGIGGLIDSRVLGVGYEVIHGLLRGEILGAAVIGLLIGKSLVWSIALGSGTSGGVLAPLLMMGAALGVLASRFLPVGSPGLWAAIGMAAMMGGTMRSPLTAMVFTLELTHDLNILPGLLVGCVAAQAVTVLLLRRSILTEKLARRGFHLTREYNVDLLEMARIGEIMITKVPTVPSTMPLADLHGPLRHGKLIVDAQGHLVGIITQSDLLQALESPDESPATVLEAGSHDLIVVYPDEVLREAVAKMLRNDIGHLPVVDRANPRHIVGYLDRARIMTVRQQRHDEENIRERPFDLGASMPRA
ncbi:MAG: Chloride channel protein [Chthonomonadales bacterium]|nr:Chloride channel protein [Chthonomonadales bacterium]